MFVFLSLWFCIEIPVSRREYNIVFKAISSEIGLLFRNNTSSSIIFVNPPKSESTVVGSICFSKLKYQNYKIRSLFVDLISSVPSSISYWNNLFEDINWPFVWSLPQNFFLTNKIKEISYKIIHRFYPVKVFLKRFRNNIDTFCSFCETATETESFTLGVLFQKWSFWYDVKALIIQNVFCDFSLCYRHILFGFFTNDKILIKARFCINLLLFIGKFYIHKCKFTKSKPHFNVFKQELNLYLDTILKSTNSKAIKTIQICTMFKMCN